MLAVLGPWQSGCKLAGALMSPPAVQWGALTPEGTFDYAWTMEKTAGGNKVKTVNMRLQKGTQDQVPYVIDVKRTVSQPTVKMTMTGSLTLTNPNPAPAAPATGKLRVTTVALLIAGGSGAATAAAATCDQALPFELLPGSANQLRCSFDKAAFNGYPAAATARAEVAFADVDAGSSGQVTLNSDPVSYSDIKGRFSTALLTDKFDTSAITSLYTGFNGFTMGTVWRYQDPSKAVPDAGRSLTDSALIQYTVVVGTFVVCTDSNGVSIANSATLTPQDPSGNGAAIISSASVQLAVFGCDKPPDVTFQDLASWGALSFTWQLDHRAQRNQFSVDQNAGSVGVDYSLKATAVPGTGSYAVSGAVFINNVQPGILNIARLIVQLSTGQQVYPSCSMTSPYVASDGLVWGGVNAGGSITTMPSSWTTAGITLVGGSNFVQFVLPQYTSCTCRFNVSIGNSIPGDTVEVMPMVYWGFGGMYTLNQPPVIKVQLRPVNRFFPVGSCISLSTQVTSGSLTLSNNGPIEKQACVQGQFEPFVQPPAFDYTITAAVNPTTTADCQPGSSKTYTISSTALGTVPGVAGTVPSAVADPVQITVNCPKPAETLQSVTTFSLQDQANLKVDVGGFITYVAVEHAWTVEKSVDQTELSLAIGELPKTITYKIKATKQPPSDNKHFVYGKITVTNQGAAAVAFTAVSVTAGTAAVRADCPEGVSSIDPNVGVLCTFNVSWNAGASAGRLGARVDTPAGSFFGAPQPFDFTNPRRGNTRGVTADILDDFTAVAPEGATGVPKQWFSVQDDMAPPPTSSGVPLTTGDTAEYAYSVTIGPFADAGACGTYKLANLATLKPSDTKAPVTAAADVAVSVTGCDGKMAFMEVPAALSGVVGGVKASVVSSVSWSIQGTPKPDSLEMPYTDTAQAAFNMRLVKLPSTRREVSGTVSVSNLAAPARDVILGGLAVAAVPEGGGTTSPAVDAVCGGKAFPIKIAPGGGELCTFTVVVDGDAPGAILATVIDGDGIQTELPRAQYSFQGAEAAANAPQCATATTGTLVGLPTWLPDGALGFSRSDQQICDTQTITVPVTVGPFAPSQCGSFVLVSVATVQPQGGAGKRPPVTTSTQLPIVVTGCPKGAPAPPLITVPPSKVEVRHVHAWRARLSSNATNPLVIKQKEPVKVVFVAETSRSPEQTSVDVSGAVMLEAPGDAPLVVSKATMSVYDASGAYTTAPLNCGEGSLPGGPVTLPGVRKPVTCTYYASGLTVTEGALLASIVPEGAGGAPAPTNPVVYLSTGAPRSVIGDCAEAGASGQLLRGLKGAMWQPAAADGDGFAAGADCGGGGTQRFALWFGGDKDGRPLLPACGDYVFDQSLTVLPDDGDAVVDEAEVAVKVVQCKKR